MISTYFILYVKYVFVRTWFVRGSFVSVLFFFFLFWTGVQKLFSDPPEGGLDLVTNRQGAITETFFENSFERFRCCCHACSSSLSLQAAGTDHAHKRYLEASAHERWKLAGQSVDKFEKLLSGVVSTMLREGYWKHWWRGFRTMYIVTESMNTKDLIFSIVRIISEQGLDEREQKNAGHRDTYAEHRASRLQIHSSTTWSLSKIVKLHLVRQLSLMGRLLISAPRGPSQNN